MKTTQQEQQLREKIEDVVSTAIDHGYNDYAHGIHSPNAECYSYAKAKCDQLIALFKEEQVGLIEELVNRILARLSIEVMDVTLMKEDDLYYDGHIHGVNRAIYLIKELYAPEVTPKTFRLFPQQKDSLNIVDPEEEKP